MMRRTITQVRRRRTDVARSGEGVVVLHDYFTQTGGAERVALLLANTLGAGSVTTSTVVYERTFPDVEDLAVRSLLPPLPRAVATGRITLGPLAGLGFLGTSIGRGTVICSSSGWSHWVRGRAPRLVYCHTPARWLYEPGDYFKSLPRVVRDIVGSLVSPLRLVDRQRMRSASIVVANSSVTAERIRRAYSLDAIVVPPPVGLNPDGREEPAPGVSDGFYLVVSRSRGYKNLDLVRSAFLDGDYGQLVIVGGDSVEESCSHIHNLGRVPDAQLRWLYRRAKAVLALSREDFGLVPIEAFLFGTPVVALAAGGYLTTCKPGVNAILVASENTEALTSALKELDVATFDPEVVKGTAAPYSQAAFCERIQSLADQMSAS